MKIEVNNIKGFLFDLDGVLVDTEPRYTEFWSQIGRDYGMAPTFAQDIKGSTLKSILTVFNENDRETIIRRIHEFEDNMQYDFFDGAIEFLAWLKSFGKKIALNTSSDDVKMSYIFAQHPRFKSFFDEVIDGTMVTHSKPDPESYLLAAKKIGCDIHECAVFEDSLQGLEAGRRSGAIVIGIATTNPQDKILPLSDIVLDSIADWRSLL